MLYVDKYGFPVDKTGDGGDSAFRAGLLSIFEPPQQHPRTLYAYELMESGMLRRHPMQMPWDNPYNFSRDQLIVLITGIYALGEFKLARRVFRAIVANGFFCLNFERDWPGSKKYPYPHEFFKDSRPTTETRLLKFNFRTFKFESRLFSNEGVVETKMFDYADILMPDQIWHIILCSRSWYLYWFAILGVPWFCASLFFHSKSVHKEHHQVICQAMMNGKWAIKLFKRWIPGWYVDVWNYWALRNEVEYGQYIIKYVEKV